MTCCLDGLRNCLDLLNGRRRQPGPEHGPDFVPGPKPGPDFVPGPGPHPAPAVVPRDVARVPHPLWRRTMKKIAIVFGTVLCLVILYYGALALSCAELAWFSVRDENWEFLYTRFCSVFGPPPEPRIGVASEKRPLEKQSDADYFYCSDDFLKTNVQDVLYTVLNRLRAAMNCSLSLLCVVNGEHVLNSEETLRLARLSGFDGNASDWMKDFRLLCAQFGRRPRQGLDQVSLIMRLLDDKEAICAEERALAQKEKAERKRLEQLAVDCDY